MPKIRNWEEDDELDELPAVEHIRRRPKDEKDAIKKNKKHHNEEARQRKEYHDDNEM